MSRLPISAFIIAKNEADRIPKAILSVRDWVDEVIVIDSGSTDATLTIAAAYAPEASTSPRSPAIRTTRPGAVR